MSLFYYGNFKSLICIHCITFNLYHNNVDVNYVQLSAIRITVSQWL